MSKLSRAEKKALKKQQNQLEVKDTCVNCEQFIALDQRFCSYCGGKRIYNKLTWRNLLEDFVDRFFNLENSFVKTFVALFKCPEDVIGGYINGMRKKYLPAFSYFAIALTVAGIYSFFLKNYFADSFIDAQIDASSIFNIDSEQIDAQKKFAEGWAKEWVGIATDYQSVLYFAAIPLLAVISRLVFWNYKKFNFVEHFVIYLYAYSQTAMITSVLYLCFMWNTTIFQVMSFIVMPLSIIYMAFVLKRLFNLDIGGILLKTGLFAIITAAIMFIMGLVFTIYLVVGLVNSDGKKIEEETGIMKLMRGSFEHGKNIGRERKKRELRKDSIKRLDSLKRLEYELEITPDMIKNRPQ